MVLNPTWNPRWAPAREGWWWETWASSHQACRQVNSIVQMFISWFQWLQCTYEVLTSWEFGDKYTETLLFLQLFYKAKIFIKSFLNTAWTSSWMTWTSRCPCLNSPYCLPLTVPFPVSMCTQYLFILPSPLSSHCPPDQHRYSTLVAGRTCSPLMAHRACWLVNFVNLCFIIQWGYKMCADKNIRAHITPLTLKWTAF